MYKIKKINSQNIEEVEFIYKNFYMRAFQDFGFEIQPLEFKDIARFIDGGILNIIALYDSPTVAKGMLIYTVQPNVIELSIIHCFGDEDVENKKIEMMKAFMQEVRGKGHKLISYAMLGIQADFVRRISSFGFEFVGQAVVRFKFNDPKSMKLFEKLGNAPVPEGFEIVNWSDKYKDDVIKLIGTSFKGMQDAKFDPRFETQEGCADILSKVVDNIYGEFLPNITKILLKDGVPKGFCLSNLTTPSIANVPLIGIDNDLKGQGFGKLLLQQVVGDAIKAVMSGDMPITEINATVDTDNYSAIRMYRYLGFREDANYPQAYCRLEN